MRALLSFETVSGPFARGAEARLQGVHLEVRPGDALVLVGNRRSGVRRLLRMALDLEAPTKGRIARHRPPNFSHWALYMPPQEDWWKDWTAAEFARWLWGACGQKVRPREIPRRLQREGFPAALPLARFPRLQRLAFRFFVYLRAGSAILFAESAPDDLPEDLTERLHRWCSGHLEAGGSLVFFLQNRSPDPLLRALHPEALYFTAGRLVHRGFLAELEKTIRLSEFWLHGVEREDFADLPVWRLSPDPEGWRVLLRASDAQRVARILEDRGAHLLREAHQEVLLAEVLEL